MNLDLLREPKLDPSLRALMLQGNDDTVYRVMVRVQEECRETAARHFGARSPRRVYTVVGATQRELLSLTKFDWIEDITVAEPLEQL